MRVLLVDDHRLLLEGLQNLLTAHGIQIVGTAGDGLEAIAQARAHKPDLILMDIRMPRCDGLTATRMIKAEEPRTRIVMLTTSAEDEDLFEAIKSGASGYLLKNMTGPAFIEALEGLEQGVPPFSPGLANKILTEFARQAPSAGSTGAHATEAAEATPGAAGLTERQLQVVELVGQGMPYKEVGARLGLSERTVRYHMAEVMEQLHLRNRSQVVAFAARAGLSPGKP